MVNESKVEKHYEKPNLYEVIVKALQDTGLALDSLSLENLSMVDEFHIGGTSGTKFVTEKLNYSENSKILDIGCGIGGPARFLVEISNCSVTGIDLTSSYIETGNKLTKLMGLEDRVQLVKASALEIPFDKNSFDSSYMIHVGMNIKEKARLMGEVFRVTKAEGTFVIYDVMKLRDLHVDYPLPWADKKEESAVDLISTYETELLNAGFQVIEKEVKTDFAIKFFENMIENINKSGPPPLGLHLLMGKNTKEKISNVFRQIKEKKLAPVVIVSKK